MQQPGQVGVGGGFAQLVGCEVLGFVLDVVDLDLLRATPVPVDVEMLALCFE